MSGQSSDDTKSTKERPARLGEPAPDFVDGSEAQVTDGALPAQTTDSGDPFDELDGLAVLRRLAQDAGKPDKSPSRFRRLRRKARQGNKHRRSTRRGSTGAPTGLNAHSQGPEEDEDTHSPNWCPTAETNILMGADRSCPACGRDIEATS